MGVRHEVVICTKDRPIELRRCLDALLVQDDRPERILVIDASSAARKSDLSRCGANIEHLSAPPGLTSQRNCALGMLRSDTEIVHFLDDDAVPEAGYLREMNAALMRTQSAVGAAGRITDLPAHSPWLLERLFLVNSRRQGALLRSGVNVLVFDGAEDRPVDWLTGCCMSYRVRLISGLRFDERRLGGGLGEDVDFSSRAGVRGALIWASRARTAHLYSPMGRDHVGRVARADVLHRWRLAADGVGGVERRWVIYSSVGMVVVQAARAARKRRMEPLQAGLGALVGLVDVLRSGLGTRVA